MQRQGLSLIAVVSVLVVLLAGSPVNAGTYWTGDISPISVYSWTSYSNCYIGLSGYGLVRVNGGDDIECGDLTLGYGPGVTGELELSGSSTSVSVGSDLFYSSMYVGLYGSGEVTIQSGASLQSENDAVLGYDSNSSGEVTVSGSGSSWQITDSDYDDGYLYIGVNGTGTLNVDSGADVDLLGYCSLGYYGDSSGSLNLDAADFSCYDLYVGNGGRGEVHAADGSYLYVDSYFSVGYDYGSTGSAIISGQDTVMDVNYAIVGDFDDGTMVIGDGASMYCFDTTGWGMTIGYDEQAIGLVWVIGSGSALVADTINVGYEGSATLAITENGLVATDWIYGPGEIKMKTGGQLAVYGDGDASLDEFYDLAGGDAFIYYENISTEQWDSIDNAVRGTDYTLEFHQDGNLEGYTVLTVGNIEPQYMAGDADTDGDVDIYDFLILRSNYGTTSGAEWADGDFDADGDVDIYDFLNLRSNYGKSN